MRFSLKVINLFTIVFLFLLLAVQNSFAATPEWTQLIPNNVTGSPIARGSSHISAWDSTHNRLLLFGGNDSAHGTYLNDLWQYTATAGWQLLTPQGTIPSIRTNHSVIWDPEGNRLLVFGGYKSLYTNELWQYTDANGWQLLTGEGAPGSPPGRDDTIAAWDTQNHRLLVFGGQGSGVIYNDLWEYTDAGGWQLVIQNNDPASPLGRSSGTGTWDSHNNRLLIFGGSTIGSGALPFTNDLWEYRAATGWHLLTSDGATTSPAQRERPVAVWDSYSNRFLIFGGETHPALTQFNDLWQYTDGGGWQELTSQNASTSPSVRQDSPMIWDTNENRLLVFGGYNRPSERELNDLWQYKESTVNANPAVNTIVVSANPVQINTSITTSASFADTDSSNTHTAVWTWGDGTTSNGTVTESNGSGTVSGSHTYSAAGVYTILLTVTDNNNGVGTNVYEYQTVYDVNAGWVAGSKEFSSPAGAVTGSINLTGKADFGFQVKYKQGDMVPSGKNVVFSFPAGNIDFTSTSYQWLVVNGSKAIFKASGSLNGLPGYTILVSAIDQGNGQQNGLIRIQIRNPGNTIVYDTQTGASDTADPTTTVTKGKISVH